MLLCIITSSNDFYTISEIFFFTFQGIVTNFYLRHINCPIKIKKNIFLISFYNKINKKNTCEGYYNFSTAEVNAFLAFIDKDSELILFGQKYFKLYQNIFFEKFNQALKAKYIQVSAGKRHCSQQDSELLTSARYLESLYVRKCIAQ